MTVHYRKACLFPIYCKILYKPKIKYKYYSKLEHMYNLLNLLKKIKILNKKSFSTIFFETYLLLIWVLWAILSASSFQITKYLCIISLYISRKR